ncbi:MAG: hypothetical protein ABFD69_03120 [Candidatus Sumerlaeia bacterium]
MIELKYIEDPNAARVVREISARWPEIGRAADHPLTDFFIRSGSRDSILVQNGSLLVCLLLIVCSKFGSFPEAQAQGFARWLLIAICVFIAVMIIRVPFRKKKRHELTWKELLFSKQDKNRWVWLSGLQLPECAAIAFTYEYWKGTWSRSSKTIWFYLLFTVVVICWLTGALAFSPGKAFALMIYPVGMLYIRAMLDPGIVAVYAIAEAEDPLDRFGISNVSWFLTVLVVVVCIAIGDVPIVCGMVMTAMLCACLFLLPQGYTKHVNTRYESLLKEEATYFRKVLVPERFK